VVQQEKYSPQGCLNGLYQTLGEKGGSLSTLFKQAAKEEHLFCIPN
jgi:hypothetical protein